MGGRPGQARREPKYPLDHERRQRIYALVSRYPGLNLNQLMEASGLTAGPLRHHLEVLEEEVLVVRHESPRGEEVVFFSDRNEHLWDREETRVLFGNEATRRVALYLSRHPGASASEVAESLGVHYMTVRHHLGRLQEAGLLSTERDGRVYHYDPTEAMQEWVDNVGQVLEEMDRAGGRDPDRG